MAGVRNLEGSVLVRTQALLLVAAFSVFCAAGGGRVSVVAIDQVLRSRYLFAVEA